MVAELAGPDLVAIVTLYLLDFTVNVEDSFAFGALSRITRSQLCLISQGLETDPINICIDLLTEKTSRRLLV